jgi:hypothetical protein
LNYITNDEIEAGSVIAIYGSRIEFIKGLIGNQNNNFIELNELENEKIKQREIIKKKGIIPYDQYDLERKKMEKTLICLDKNCHDQIENLKRYCIGIIHVCKEFPECDLIITGSKEKNIYDTYFKDIVSLSEFQNYIDFYTEIVLYRNKLYGHIVFY